MILPTLHTSIILTQGHKIIDVKGEGMYFCHYKHLIRSAYTFKNMIQMIHMRYSIRQNKKYICM